jgi:hypothetical protein
MTTFTAPKRITRFTSHREKRSEFRAAGFGPLQTEAGETITTETGLPLVVEGDVYVEVFTAPKRVTQFTARG